MKIKMKMNVENEDADDLYNRRNFVLIKLITSWIKVWNNHLNTLVIAVFDVDDDVKHIRLHIDNMCNLVESMMMILIVDVDVERTLKCEM